MDKTEFDHTLTARDWAVLRAMDDEWKSAAFIADMAGLSAKVALGRLNSLRSRGLTTYRPVSVTAHEHTRSGDWALTDAGDRLVWDVRTSPEPSGGEGRG